MIRRLRRRHLLVITASVVVLPVVFAGAIAVRRPMPVMEPFPAMFGGAPASGEPERRRPAAADSAPGADTSRTAAEDGRR